MSLSVVILTRNEEKNIATCLKGLSFADEIVVVDDYSTDSTVEIARNFGARVFRRKLENDFATQRNFADTKARGDWVLHVDADEVISPPLREELIQIVNQPINQSTINAFFLPRRDIFFGKELRFGEAGRTKLLRLYKNRSGKWHRAVHEVYKVKGETSALKNVMYHFSHTSIRSFIASINYYTTLHAIELSREGKKSNWEKIILMPSGSFIINFIWRLGFRDGIQGFMMALMMSLHSFLGWGKLWQLQKIG